jgi:[acyl-carrier-protein] S-malonyltransferase
LFAGRLVGELATAAGAGYLTPPAAIGLSRARGLAMSAACVASRTGMAAVMPGKRDPAPDEAIAAAIRAAGLTVANWNGGHQFVAAGPAGRLEAFAAAPPAGMRIAPLEVAGAFHTEAMAAAVAPFARAVEQAPFLSPASAMLGNGDGALVAGPDDLRRRLVAQITSAVRWDLCSAAIAELSGPDAVRIELAPAGPLTRLAERACPGLRAIALRAPHDAGRLRPAAGGDGRNAADMRAGSRG